MARECAICGKGKSVGNRRKLLRGNYNITAKRDFKPNLQKIKHEGNAVLACTKCIRTKSKPAKVKTAKATSGV